MSTGVKPDSQLKRPPALKAGSNHPLQVLEFVLALAEIPRLVAQTRQLKEATVCRCEGDLIAL